MAVQKGVEYREIDDELIKDVKVGIELFVKDNEYWERFAHRTSVPQGHEEFTFRRLVKPRVRAEDVKPSAEYIAPRPSKFAVQTFKKGVKIYRDKAIYSKEDLMYHFDDTVNNLRATLQEIVRQKREFIYGKAFVSSACTLTYATSLINTLDNGAITLRKNDAKRWDGVHYLAHITPEILKALRAEIREKGQSISEPTKKELDANLLGSWGDWTFSVSTSPVLYKNDSTQIMVLMGKRGIDGNSPVDISQMEGEGLEVINNGLGSGVLVDEDGNYTSDDNKQQGSIAINMNGLGSAVNDDLCILNCEVSVNAIKGSVLNASEKAGFVSGTGCTLTITPYNASGALAGTTIVVKKKNSSGATVSASSGKYTLVAGDTYYISVSKDGYTTGVFYYVANAGDNTFAPVLATA